MCSLGSSPGLVSIGYGLRTNVFDGRRHRIVFRTDENDQEGNRHHYSGDRDPGNPTAAQSPTTPAQKSSLIVSLFVPLYCVYTLGIPGE